MLMRPMKNTAAPALAALMALGVSAGAAAARASDLDPQIVKLVGSVSEERLGAILRKLESFETRDTISSTDSPTRGRGAPRECTLKEEQI